ncbi:MAG: hypothetical protein ABJB11_17245 [Ferruginibacter sp.]
MQIDKTKKLCFVISPIGEPDSQTRKRSDKILKFIIIPAVEKFDYEAIRADQISEPGIITSQVIQKIVESDLVIADLTDKNPNVFYELALRHAIKKPLIQIISKDDTIPFDIAATRVIRFDIQDLDSVENAKTEIANQILIVKSGKVEFDNPISISFDIKKLNESGNPEQRSIADIVQSLSEIRGIVTNLESKANKASSILSVDYIINLLKIAVNQITNIEPREETVEYYEYIQKEILDIKEKLDENISNLPKGFNNVGLINILERLSSLSKKSNRFLEIAKHFRNSK